MQKQVLNYRIIIEPEKMGKKTAYNAYEFEAKLEVDKFKSMCIMVCI